MQSRDIYRYLNDQTSFFRVVVPVYGVAPVHTAAYALPCPSAEVKYLNPAQIGRDTAVASNIHLPAHLFK